MNNLTEIFELEVTQTDIDGAIAVVKENGCYNISDICVITRASRRQLDDEKIISAGGRLYPSKEKAHREDAIWDGGDELWGYMSAFDCRDYEELKPRKFILVKL